MRIKVPVCALGASMALLGCAHLASSDPSAGNTSPKTCTGLPCEVPVGKWGILYVMPDRVTVKTGTQITWTLDSTFPSDTSFHPTKGIEFNKEYEKLFDCKGNPPGAPRTYTCTNNAPMGGPYKYTIRTRGRGTPGDSDPTVVNN